MKISFSYNHDGDILVLVDGKVECLANTCEGAELLQFVEVSKIKKDNSCE